MLFSCDDLEPLKLPAYETKNSGLKTPSNLAELMAVKHLRERGKGGCDQIITI